MQSERKSGDKERLNQLRYYSKRIVDDYEFEFAYYFYQKYLLPNRRANLSILSRALILIAQNANNDDSEFWNALGVHSFIASLSHYQYRVHAERTISYFEKAISLDANNHVAMLNLAMFYLYIDEITNANKYIDIAIKLTLNKKMNRKEQEQLSSAIGIFILRCIKNADEKKEASNIIQSCKKYLTKEIIENSHSAAQCAFLINSLNPTKLFYYLAYPALYSPDQFWEEGQWETAALLYRKEIHNKLVHDTLSGICDYLDELAQLYRTTGFGGRHSKYCDTNNKSDIHKLYDSEKPNIGVVAYHLLFTHIILKTIGYDKVISKASEYGYQFNCFMQRASAIIDEFNAWIANHLHDFNLLIQAETDLKLVDIFLKTILTAENYAKTELVVSQLKTPTSTVKGAEINSDLYSHNLSSLLFSNSDAARNGKDVKNYDVKDYKAPAKKTN